MALSLTWLINRPFKRILALFSYPLVVLTVSDFPMRHLLYPLIFQSSPNKCSDHTWIKKTLFSELEPWEEWHKAVVCTKACPKPCTLQLQGPSSYFLCLRGFLVSSASVWWARSTFTLYSPWFSSSYFVCNHIMFATICLFPPSMGADIVLSI